MGREAFSRRIVENYADSKDYEWIVINAAISSNGKV
jgi:hypothetical protein